MSTSSRFDEITQSITQLTTQITSRPTATLHIHRGMSHFRLAHISESLADFDAAERLDPRVQGRLWQRGLSYYYAGRFAEGAAQFALDLAGNARDAEETLWRFLCVARIHGPESEEAKAALHDSRQLAVEDSREYMRRIFAVYLGKIGLDELVNAYKPPSRASFYANLYAGLLCEVRNEPELARRYICAAVERQELDDYMWDLAWVHRRLRGWEAADGKTETL